VTSGGAIAQAPGTSITVSGTASFDAGTNAITLTQSGNNFGTVSLNSTGTAAVQVADTSGVALGTVRLRTGPLTVTSTGPITQSGALTQAVAGGMLTLSAGTSLSLNNASNDFTGKVVVTQATGVTLTNRGNLDLRSSSALSGDVTLRSGGKIDL